jgi:hypothetical protein
VIAEVEVGMMPVLEMEAQQGASRLGKRFPWKESKRCLAHERGSL